ncbi:uncharacterized protein [Epargyreus clarus]|uniref:uncharacterized protein n=1 Tax=Epargyreus clarus TaxID=520877 RepID=UPI003C2AE03D
MEAATLKTKKQIKKGKLKKTMKNVISRPDPPFWPQLSEEEGKLLEEELNKLRIEIPIFKKPSWSEISHIPKKMRPKAPLIPKVHGLLFGIGECKKYIATEKCLGVLIEADVNPRAIVQPLIELCTDKTVPVVCFKDLRKIAKINFGIPTSALGVEKNILTELEKLLLDISKSHRPPKKDLTTITEKENCTSTDKTDEAMDVDEKISVCPYLYRTDNKTRVFTPCLTEDTPKSDKFVGQDFIELSNTIPKERMDRKEYMKMIIKKMGSNPNRIKRTKVSPHN